MSEQKHIIPLFAPIYRCLSAPSLAIFRIVVGLFLVPHGAQKLFGLFGGGGISGTAQFFTSIGLPVPTLAAIGAGSVEFFGGLLIALGLFTRPAAAAASFLLFVAVVSTHLQNGFFAGNGGYEYAMLWMFATLLFVIRGGEKFSVDRLIGREF